MTSGKNNHAKNNRKQKSLKKADVIAGNHSILHVIYGSRTGNSRAAAVLAHEYAKFLGLQSELINLQEFQPENIRSFNNILIAVSTHGEGDPPLAAEKLLAYLLEIDDPVMKGKKFSVLALGDSSYRHYCKTGHDFQNHLVRLGAEKIYDLKECDIDFEEGAKSWIEGSVNAFKNILPVSKTENSRQFAFELMLPDTAHGELYMAKILEKKILNEGNPVKQTMHVKLSLKNSGISYQAGDTIGISGFNSRSLVDDLVRQQGYDPTHVLENKEVKEMLKQALISDYELTLLTPVVLKKYAGLTKNAELARLLENDRLLEEYYETKDILDMVSDFPSDLTVAEFISVLRKLPPRLYSVAGSPKKSPETVDLLVGIVSIPGKERIYEGVCSSFLSDRLEEGESVGIHLEENEKFRLPAGDVPIIMIGAGTGVAPFRAFLQDREASGATGRNWLFFGEQFNKTDFFYREEFEGYLKSGLLTRLDTAFSRDQEEKIYVSHRMLENSRELFRWIKAGAVVYLCGNKRKLAVSVRRAMLKILEREGSMTPDEATGYFEKMKSEKRFLEDVY